MTNKSTVKKEKKDNSNTLNYNDEIIHILT